MAVSVTHATTATGTDAGTGEIHKAEWNAGHTVTGAALASHTHAGEDVTSGTVADARIAATIARDSEITATALDTLAATTDITTRNASTSAHGLLPKLDNNAAHFLDGTGAWATPSGAGLGAWTTFTPSWTSDGSAPTLNNGTLTGRYKQLDSKTYAIQINFVFGSTSAAGSGNYSFSLPAGLTSGSLVQVLAGVVLDSGTRFYLGAGYIAAGGTTVTWIVNSESGGAGRTGQTTPMTFATGDEVNLSGIIEVA